jgi:hypothetical protein
LEVEEYNFPENKENSNVFAYILDKCFFLYSKEIE